MEFSPREQSHLPVNVVSQPLDSSRSQSSQVAHDKKSYIVQNPWGSEQFLSSGSVGEHNSIGVSMLASARPPYYVTPMRAQVGASPAEASIVLGLQPTAVAPLPSRVSLRPQYFMNAQAMPMPVAFQSSASASRKLQPAGPLFKTQVQETGRVQSSNKRSLQKEQVVSRRQNPEALESVRSKFRESLVSALSSDHDPQNKTQTSDKSSVGESKAEQIQDEAGQQDAFSPKFSNGKEGSSHIYATEKVHNADTQNSYDKSLNAEAILGSEEQFLPQNLESNYFVAADELLQGHGLCWVSETENAAINAVIEPDSKRIKIVNDIREVNELMAHNGEDLAKKAEKLAFRIEAELFKIMGGVNKKYKEKARSLLFNLKDRSNPELRERVLSGSIAPEQLCNMSAEELASKELSEWRQAKAEELQQMVVLPDSEVDVRQLVKKTHKGEFRVEVEETDNIAMEVSLGTNVVSSISARTKEEGEMHSKESGANETFQSEEHAKESPGSPRTEQSKVSGSSSLDEKASSGDDNSAVNLELIVNEKTDLMQELMVDELKDTGDLPPIVTLDEFMLSLDTEPPFEDLAVGASVDEHNSGEEDMAMSDQEKNFASVGSDQVPASGDGSGLRQDPPDDKGSLPEKRGHDAEKNDFRTPGRQTHGAFPDEVDSKTLSTDKNTKTGMGAAKPEISVDDNAMISGCVWEGALQLNLGSVANVFAVYKSGEKPSSIEWPRVVEIKGRVRNDAFGKFLQELPLSRSRAIMVVDIICKQGSPESSHRYLSEASESYISSERVGFAEPCSAVEMYLCPSHPKMLDVLSPVLAKEHLEHLSRSGNLLVGIIVWRRPHKSSRAPHHRQSAPRRQLSSSGRRQAQVSAPAAIADGPPPGFPNPIHEDDVTDDVPPGFGPSVVAREDDDLPEFDFVNASASRATDGKSNVSAEARPMQQRVRELVLKYGQGENANGGNIEVEPWNDDDDDDIPEWNPNQSKPQQSAQPIPPPTPVQQMQGYHHPPHQPSFMHQQQPRWQPHLAQQLAAPPPGWQARPQQPSDSLWWSLDGGVIRQPVPQLPFPGVYTGIGTVPAVPLNPGQPGQSWRRGPQ